MPCRAVPCTGTAAITDASARGFHFGMETEMAAKIAESNPKECNPPMVSLWRLIHITFACHR